MATNSPSIKSIPVYFSHDFSWERRVLIFILLIHFLGLVSGFVIWVTLGTRGVLVTFLIAILIIILTVALSIILYKKYSSLPKVAEKKQAVTKLENLKSQSTQIQGKITALERENKIILRKLAIKAAELRTASETRQLQFDNQLDNINQAEKARLQDTLSQMQTDSVTKELLLARVLNATIPGVNLKLKERIRNSGITSAEDVNLINLKNVPGLGEETIQELLGWRREIENYAQLLMPKRLDTETEAKIVNEFGQKKADVRLEKLKEENKLAAEIKRSIEASAKLAAENIDDIERHQETYSEILNSISRIKIRLESYAGITFINYLRGGLEGKEGESGVKPVRAVGAAGVIILGIIFQSGLAAKSTSAILVGSVPTSTPTPTETLTSTITFTPLPKITFTPTWTATITQTPTFTFTSTVTATTTLTPTATTTLPPIIGASCIPQASREIGMVIAVMDGDTILVDINGQDYKVRYIGIDALEPVGSTLKMGEKALHFNETLVNGKQVILIKDVSDVDIYDRLLRYVIVDNVFVNYEMVYAGYASAFPYPPDTACSEVFLNAQSTARLGLLGIWAPTRVPTVKIYPTITHTRWPTAITNPTIVSTRWPTATTNPYFNPTSVSGNCDPSYPTVCIPSPPPDLDCPEIPYRDFRVLWPDPHRFDGDDDGIGCET